MIRRLLGTSLLALVVIAGCHSDKQTSTQTATSSSYKVYKLRGKVVSANAATGEVTLKISQNDSKRIEPNTVTVMVSEEISQKTVGVYLLDATTGAELGAPLTVDVAISM